MVKYFLAWGHLGPWGLGGVESERSPTRGETQPRQRSGPGAALRSVVLVEPRHGLGWPADSSFGPGPGNAAEPSAAWTPALATSLFLLSTCSPRL